MEVYIFPVDGGHSVTLCTAERGSVGYWSKARAYKLIMALLGSLLSVEAIEMIRYRECRGVRKMVYRAIKRYRKWSFTPVRSYLAERASVRMLLSAGWRMRVVAEAGGHTYFQIESN